jgi:hypothetical protein
VGFHVTDIQLIDDFIDEAELARLQELLLGAEFPWYFNPRVLNGVATSHDHYQFTHIFYQENKVCSGYISNLEPILVRLNILSLIRIKANLNTYTGEKLVHGFHTDYTDHRITTAVFYVNDNDGITLFDDGREVQSRANRMVLFPCNMAHSGSTPTDNSSRCVINLNFIAH